jgi:hypothetical protein
MSKNKISFDIQKIISTNSRLLFNYLLELAPIQHTDLPGVEPARPSFDTGNRLP